MIKSFHLLSVAVEVVEVFLCNSLAGNKRENVRCWLVCSVSVAVTVSPKTYNFLGLCFTIDINNQDTGGEGTGEIDKSSEENIIRH